MLLFFVLACDTLIHYRIRFVAAPRRPPGRGGVRPWACLKPISHHRHRATPLLHRRHRRTGRRALRRAQPRRRGHDGHGRGAASAWRSPPARPGSASSRALAGMLFSLLFGFLTLTLVTNQVATGLALTLLGLGLSGMIGEAFVGQPGVKLAISIPGCRPAAGRRLLLRPGPDLLHLDLLLTRRLVPVPHRAGLTLRSVGDKPRLGACARHQGVIASAISRDVRRRLRGACRRAPVARLHAAMDREHDGGPRLDRAGAGRLRLLACPGGLAGAYLFGAVTRSASFTRRRLGMGHSLAVLVGAALSGDHRRACRNLRKRRIDDDQHAGLPGAGRSCRIANQNGKTGKRLQPTRRGNT
jgi:hypothetical protein